MMFVLEIYVKVHYTQNHNLCLNLIFISNNLEGKYTGIVHQLTEKKKYQKDNYSTIKIFYGINFLFIHWAKR